MRRLVLAVLACLFTLVFTGIAAASNPTFQFHISGATAAALWTTTTSNSFTDTSVLVTQSGSGPKELMIDQFTANLDSMGNFTGGTDTFADVTGGFSFTIDKKTLASASVEGTGVPAQTCTLDINGDVTGCADTSIGVSASWTGQGPIFRAGLSDHFHSPGFTETFYFGGTNRDASATGTVGGLTLGAGDLVFADLGVASTGSVTVCLGGGC